MEDVRAGWELGRRDAGRQLKRETALGKRSAVGQMAPSAAVCARVRARACGRDPRAGAAGGR